MSVPDITMLQCTGPDIIVIFTGPDTTLSCTGLDITLVFTEPDITLFYVLNWT